MSTQDNGGPAFPAGAFEPEGRGSMCWQDGMTLRDYFAAKAMTAMLDLCKHDAHEGAEYTDYIAGVSYRMADAMLKARQQ